MLVGLVGIGLGEVGGFVVESFEHYNYYNPTRITCESQSFSAMIVKKIGVGFWDA